MSLYWQADEFPNIHSTDRLRTKKGEASKTWDFPKWGIDLVLEQELRIYLCHESTVSQDNSALGGNLGTSLVQHLVPDEAGLHYL